VSVGQQVNFLQSRNSISIEKIIHEAVKYNPNDTATKGLCMWHISSGSVEIMYCEVFM